VLFEFFGVYSGKTAIYSQLEYGDLGKFDAVTNI
jgi:hypothetical protein